MYKRIHELIESSSLKAKAMRGGAWLGTGSVAEQTARFVRNLILARLLAPSAFGTMAVVLSVSSVLGSLTDVGVRDALIQNPRGSERRYAEAAWWMAFGRAAATYILLFAAAPWVARFYGNAELSLLLRVGVIGLLFEGAMSAHAYVSLKEMKFSKWTAILNGGGIIGVVITVILSLFIRDVWALVLGSCAESVARCLLSYVICPFFPTLRWDREVFRDLLTFSRKLFGLSVLHLLFLRADVFVLAKLFSATQLGLYTMAVFLVQVPSGFLISLMGQVLMPALSEIQSDTERMNRIVLQVSALIVFLGMPVLVFLLVCGGPLLTVVYGQSYAPAALPLAIAGCVAMVSMINVQLTIVLYASGHPNLHRRCVAAMAGATLLLVYPLTKWLGLVGGQVAALIAMIAGFLLQAERVPHVTGFKVIQYGRILLGSAAGSAAVPVVWLAAQTLFPTMRPITSIAYGALGCLLAYAIAGATLLRRWRSTESLFSSGYLPHGVITERVDL